MNKKAQAKFLESLRCTLSVSPRLEATLSLLRTIRASRILDIGCGDGSNSVLLGKQIGARELWGIDISPKAVELSRSKGLHAFNVNVDEEDLPFENGFFDVITALEVVEHLYDPDRMMNEVRRVLRKGGRVVMSTLNLAWWLNRMVLVFGYQPFGTEVSTADGRLGKLTYRQCTPVGHLRVFTRRAFHQFVNLHGFRVIQEKPASFSYARSLFCVIDSLLSRVPCLAFDVVYLLEARDVEDVRRKSVR